MIYFEIDKNGNMVYENHFPFDPVHGLGKSKEELLTSGYLVESLPEIQPKEGYAAQLNYNPQTGEFSTSYNSLPLTVDGRVQQLESDLGQILMESAADKAKITELEKAQGDLLMEFATLKMGGSA